MTTPLVSIVTPSYNQGQYLEETIRSVIDQSYPHIEYIILDALSTDSTPFVLDKYEGHPRVARIIRAKDGGQADAIEQGFRMARGEIVGWINSDDLLAPGVVERAVQQFVADEQVGLTYGDIVFIDGEGNQTQLKEPYPLLTREYLLNHDYDVFQQGSFYRKSVVTAAGYLNRELNFCMDLDLWLRILKSHQARYLEGPAGFFRWHDSTKTVNGGARFLWEIRRTLTRHGARRLPASKRTLYWYLAKQGVKRVLSGGGA